MQSRGKKLWVTGYLSCFMIFFAVIITMFSTILPKVADMYHLTLTQVSVFTIIQNYLATFLSTFLLVGWGDKFPKGIVLGVDVVVMGVLLFAIEQLPSYIVIMLLFSALNMTTGILNNMVTAFISDIYGAQRTRYISMMHVFYSIGALFGPLLPSLVASAGFAWNYTYAFLSGIVLAVAFTYFLMLGITRQMKYKPVEAPAGKDETSMKHILHHPMLIPLCLLNMIYMGGHQNLFANWFQLFLQRVDPVMYPESFTSVCMTLYWVGMLGSRLLSAFLAEKVTPRQFIMTGSFIGVLVQIVGLACNRPVFWIITCVVLGLCTGAIFPLNFAIAISWFPKNSARISSMLGLATSIGGALISWLMGRVAEWSFMAAMIIPILSLAGVYVLMRCKFSEQAPAA